MKIHSYLGFNGLPIVLNAAIPVPNTGTGTIVYSSIANAFLWWNGSSWTALDTTSAAGGGITNDQSVMNALIYG